MGVDPDVQRLKAMDEAPVPAENRSAPRTTLLGLGPAWTRVGYGVLTLAVLALVFWQVVHPVLPAPKGATPAGYKLIANKDGGWLLLASPLGAFSIFLHVFSALAGFVWTLIDVVDRRRRFVWLMPLFVCPFVQALQAFPLALYLFYGRETPEAGTNVQ